ncbi:MAG: hypothetical protein ACK4N5_03005, partial [Myxococcales bacterium]
MMTPSLRSLRLPLLASALLFAGCLNRTPQVKLPQETDVVVAYVIDGVQHAHLRAAFAGVAHTDRQQRMVLAQER